MNKQPKIYFAYGCRVRSGLTILSTACWVPDAPKDMS